MSRRRVPWDGPDPRPGEYLANRDVRCVWLIRAVAPLPQGGIDGARLTLTLARVALADVPKGAVIHPWQRAEPHDPAGPPRVRQLAAAGRGAVMRTHWRDPTDVTPNAARQPRTISGYRTYCPLRRMAAHKGSQISERHIHAADCFRAQADLAAIGYGGARDGTPLSAIAYGPRSGPPAGAVLQAWSSIDVARALARFTPSQRVMLAEIVLLNRSLYAWCAGLAAQRLSEGRGPPEPKIEMGRLLAILDILAEHYGADIDDDLRRGRLLPAL